jgi:2-methylcitrate dehydratase PrpD
MAKPLKKPVISPAMKKVSEYIASAATKPLPKDVVEKSKHHLIDTIAAMVSGSKLVPGKKAIAYVKLLGGTKESVVAGTNIVTTAVNAALANGMLAHADETDDSHQPSNTHPGCVVVPASLAMAERHGRNGTQLLRAVALGYDICCRATIPLDPVWMRKVGHASHSFGGAFGAFASASSMAGLDARQVRHALSYTAQQASGIRAWARDSEHVEKAFDFAGMPARNGVTAATMVAAGLTGVEDVLSGQYNFYWVFKNDATPDALADGLGKRFEVMNTNIKKWSVGSPIQAPLDALQAIIAQHQFRTEDIDQVIVKVDEKEARTVDNRDMPDICLQHMASIMLIDRTATFKSSHDAARMHNPKVLKLRSKVQLIGAPEMTDTDPPRQAIVSLVMKNGTELRHHVRAVRGTPDNPMTRQEVQAKSFDLLAPIVGKAKAQKLIDAVYSIEKVKDVRTLRTLMQPPK